MSERERSQLSARLNEAQQIAKIGSWDWDLRTNRVWWSEETYRIFGVKKEEYIPNFADNGNFIHPEDLGSYRQVFERCLASGEPLFFDCHLVTPGGGIKSCNTQGRAEYDADGNPIRFVGTTQDISDRKLAEERIVTQLAEKDLLLMEIHHRIKNNIASIESLLLIQMENLSNREAVEILQATIGRIESMRGIYEKLLIERNYHSASTRVYLTELVESLLRFFPDGKNLERDIDIDDFQLDAKRMFSVGLIVNELITNVMKYALVERKGKRIGVLLINREGRATLTIRDNGHGFPEGFDFDASRGFGGTLVKMLAEELGASFSAMNDEGSCCILEFNI
jgi:PAS domain S-box-containing protein